MPPLPPLHHEEAAQLLAFLEAQRHAVRIAAHGLTDDQARTAASASSLTIGGLIKHLTSTEHNWVAIISDPGHDWGDPSAYQDAYTMGPGETLADLLSAYEKVGAETESLIAGVKLDDEVPVPPHIPFFPKDLPCWTVRWVLLHLIEETAKHAGHADIVRESVDGATFFPLQAAVEGWAPTPWLQPWKPLATN
ncbi:DinB family protein [Crossiella cryophila]|uniref:DinB family protein n=1 Tax=Crossiella cryophila TaxID=43355 RepID=A0A7W7CDW7_9PSEU|nr:DinB family protein [Crossiella cryophila]MBB4678018.1 hypothetical protein [Crossiella cryophila]